MTAGPALCLGLDVAWHGGGRSRASRYDVVIGGMVGAGGMRALSIDRVYLGDRRRGHAAWESNADPEGELTAAAIVNRIADWDGPVILAIDAPLYAAPRPHLPPRKRAVTAGQQAFDRRVCERDLQARKKAMFGLWARDVHIQPGAPVPVRITHLVERLTDIGFRLDIGDRSAARRICEIFPSEAIGSLGGLGHYGGYADGAVRAYKAKDRARMTRDEVVALATRPLQGFASLVPADDAIALIAANVADGCCVGDFGTEATYRRGKMLDDVVDAGIAFLTAACVWLGNSHTWGDGGDGLIFGPGRFADTAPPRFRSDGERSGSPLVHRPWTCRAALPASLCSIEHCIRWHRPHDR